MTLKKKIMTLKSLVEMKQMAVNDPKCDLQKSLDTLLVYLVQYCWILTDRDECQMIIWVLGKFPRKTIL